MAIITAHRYEAGNESAWIALRESLNNRLGGSEIGAVANHSEYSNFLKELEYRVGAKNRPDISCKIAVMRGHYDEEFVAQLFEQFSGKKVHKANCIYTNDDFPHLKASIDRKIANENSGLECKTVNAFIMMKMGRGEFPRTFLDQCELYLAATGLDRWYLAILDGNNELHIFLMTRIKGEEDRWFELRKKFELTVDDTDPDAKEWHENWEWLDAVYYVDGEELAGCEMRAAHFFAKVDEVNTLMATQKWNSEQERLVMLTNVIAQVVDPEDYGEGDALDSAIDDLTEQSIPDSELVLDPNGAETKRLLDLLNERKALTDEIKTFSETRETRLDQIDAELKLKMNTAEKAILPGWKITYAMSNGRRSTKVEAVESYFQAQGVEVPAGLITQSKGSRTFKITEMKPKTGRKTSVKKKTSAA